MSSLQQFVRESGASIEEIADFVDFLDDKTPALFVADSISAILRTEPPVRYGTDSAASIVAAWAKDREGGDASVCDLLLRAMRKIVGAYRTNTLEGVEPRQFFRPFVAGLTARCPAGERDAFRARVHEELRGEAASRRAEPAFVEFEQTESVELSGRRARNEDAVEVATRRIEADPQMPDRAFDEVFASLDEALVSRAGTSVRAALIRIAACGVVVFNVGNIPRAAQLFSLVRSVFDRLGFTAAERDEVRTASRSERLDERRLMACVGDPRLRDEVAPVVLHFADLDPAWTLDNLETEPSRDRRRLLLGVVEIHGEAAFSAVVERLTRSRAGLTWYVARNLIYLLSRISPTDEVVRKRLATLLMPFVTSPVTQVRTATIAALARVGGREIVPALTRALDPAAYREVDPPAVERHLAHALELLAQSDVEGGVAVVAEFAIGARGEAFKLGKTLRDAGTAALESRKRTLPRRAVLAIVEHLRHQSERRVRLGMGGGTGADLPSCQRLAKLVLGSAEPEAAAVLATPFYKRLLARRTSELPGLSEP